MLVGKFKVKFKIVVEAVGDGRTDGAFRFRPEALYRLSQDVGRRMAERLCAEFAVKVCFHDVTVLVVDFHMHLPFCDRLIGSINTRKAPKKIQILHLLRVLYARFHLNFSLRIPTNPNL